MTDHSTFSENTLLNRLLRQSLPGLFFASFSSSGHPPLPCPTIKKYMDKKSICICSKHSRGILILSHSQWGYRWPSQICFLRSHLLPLPLLTALPATSPPCLNISSTLWPLHLGPVLPTPYVCLALPLISFRCQIKDFCRQVFPAHCNSIPPSFPVRFFLSSMYHHWTHFSSVSL